MKFFLLILMMFFSQSSWACDAISDGGLSLGKEGWIFRDKTDYLENFEMRQETLHGIDQLNQALHEKDISLAIVVLPTRGMAHANFVLHEEYKAQKAIGNYNRFIEKLNNSGVQAIGISNFSHTSNFFNPTDHHWTSDGAQKMAKLISQQIDKSPLTKKSFQTEKAESVPHLGSFQEKFLNTCGEGLASDTAQIYKTYALNQNIIEDENTPEVVLIGTSNSDSAASKANFEGFLKQYLEADVLNASVSGGGFQSSMLQYLSSEEYKNNKPKLIIWEFPIYQDFNDIRFYNQAVPAVFGECSNQQIFKENVEIDDNKFVVNIAADLNLEETYLSLSIDNFQASKFRLTMIDNAQNRQSFNFERSKFYKEDGKFYLDLKPYKNIQKLEAQLPKGEYTQAQLRICPYSSE